MNPIIVKESILSMKPVLDLKKHLRKGPRRKSPGTKTTIKHFERRAKSRAAVDSKSYVNRMVFKPAI